MRSRLARCGVMTAFLIAAMPVAAQQPRPTANAENPKVRAQSAKPTEVTLIGCVEAEKDYRQRLNAKKGGPLASGAGQHSEYVLSSAKPAPANGETLTAKEAVATSGQSGDYLLGGKSETELKQAINRQVEVVGIVEPFKASDSAKDARDRLPRLKISQWHPAADFCPAK